MSAPVQTRKEPLPHATVVFLGPHQSGKSTAAGHILVKLGGLDKRALERVDRETSNRPTSRYAWVLDRLRLERDRAMTLDLKICHVALPTAVMARCAAAPAPAPAAAAAGGSDSGSGAASASPVALTILDTPGHPDYLRNTITGITQADFAVLVVDSRPVVLESPSSCFQTRDLAQLATALAHQKTLIVAINYLDVAVEADPGLAEQRFNEAADSVRKLIKRQSQSATFVPFSALAGDNFIERSPRLHWWSGPTLLEAIAAAAAATPGITGSTAVAADLPLRMPLLRVYKVGGIGTVPAGRVAGGCLRQGAIARLLPPLPAADGGVACAASACEPSRGVLEGAVRSIECFHDSRAAAFTGEWVGLAVKGVPTWWLKRGCVVSDAADRPARLAARFTAKIQGRPPPRLTRRCSETPPQSAKNDCAP
ncbi:hypothetical protein Vafri_6724 [Volvox africanus]|uniref:Tr-type G domain-containing protein n=1 Tax=Volvox africanus TaxID=51714 RepID=A0A8J4B0S9_9CHLO|nr:hypothetical protein Vafri_6724 [Volvox africanus]